MPHLDAPRSRARPVRRTRRDARARPVRGTSRARAWRAHCPTRTRSSGRTRRSAWLGGASENAIDLRGTMRIRVLGADAPPCRVADRARAIGRQLAEVRRYLLARVGDQDFSIGIEELLDAFPAVRDRPPPGARRFEHARRRRESIPGHAVAADVEH